MTLRHGSCARYPIVYLGCIHTKVRDGDVRVKAVYLVLGIKLAGENEILGLWIAQSARSLVRMTSCGSEATGQIQTRKTETPM